MYVYNFRYDNYDDYRNIVLQSKVKYTKGQLYDILYEVIYEIYKEEEYPPLPCLLNWGDIFSYISIEPYKSWLRETYFLVPFDFDCTIYADSSIDNDQISNMKCYYKDYDTKDCIKSYSYCKWRNKDE